jgi:hypothetical protein
MKVQKDDHQKELEKFEKLDEEWRSEILGKQPEEWDKAIQQCATNLANIKAAQAMDPDVKSLKAQLKTANKQYTEGKKENSLKIDFILKVMRDAGHDAGSPEDFLPKGALVEDE